MGKRMLTGNQAVARGFYEAGGNVGASYPGSPTVEVMQTIKDEYPEIYGEFSVNEKVALEVAIGGSFGGARSMAIMKHVGVNVAMDPLMTFTQTPINGGFLLVTGDDPGMASSQNEQDNRILGRFANMPVLDPGTSQEALDFTVKAFELSEAYETPVMLRITSRVCHGRSVVTTGPRQERTSREFSKNPADYGMIPPNTFPKQGIMGDRIRRLEVAADSMEINRYEPSPTGRRDVLIITSGLMYQNYRELDLDFSVYCLGMVFPLPLERLNHLYETYQRIIVIEEMTPFIENQLLEAGIPCEGKQWFSSTGELHSEIIRTGLQEAGVLPETIGSSGANIETVPRIAMFCAGCPHRPVFDILKKMKLSIIGDIGCYSMAVLEPLACLNSIISMGASLGIMKGLAKANRLQGRPEPLVSVIGDGTFFHSGMTGMLNLMHQMNPEDNLTVILLNNGTTAMTGGQPTAVSGAYTSKADLSLSAPEVLKALGIEDVTVVDQFDYKKAQGAIKEALQRPGLSVVMTTRPCALAFKVKEPVFQVNPEICIACRSCIKTNCPPLLMKTYEGYEKMKSSIHPDMCVGCSVCSQVCPVGAITRAAEEVKA